jgi:uncharacterized membrane protein YfcA
VLGAALLIGGVGLLAKSFVRVREHPKRFRLTPRDRVAAVAVGLFGGLVVGLTSVGTGVFFGLSLLILFPLRSRKVVGTDIFHAAALLWVAGAGHFVAGNVNVGAVGWLLIGSIPGVLLGSQLTLKMPDRVLRNALAIVLLGSGVKLLAPPGQLVLLGLVVAGGLTILVWLERHRPAAPPTATAVSGNLETG